MWKPFPQPQAQQWRVKRPPHITPQVARMVGAIVRRRPAVIDRPPEHFFRFALEMVDGEEDPKTGKKGKPEARCLELERLQRERITNPRRAPPPKVIPKEERKGHFLPVTLPPREDDKGKKQEGKGNAGKGRPGKVEGPDKSDQQVGVERDIETVEDADGVLITALTGFEEKMPFVPIAMMNRMSGPEIMKRHSRIQIKRHGIYKVRVTNIIDPLNFYLEFVLNPPKDDCRSWDECIQHFYNEPGVAEKYKMRTLRPFAGQMYAVYTEELQKWERIRVHKMRSDENTVHGMYIDRLLPFNNLPFEELHELHPNYGNWPAHPLSGALCDVRPIGYVPPPPAKEGAPKTKRHYDWPEDAKQYFVEATKDKEFRAFVVDKAFDRTDNLTHVSDEDRFTVVSVLLFEIGAERHIPLNALMVQKGFAVGKGSLDGCEGLIDILHGYRVGGGPAP